MNKNLIEEHINRLNLNEQQLENPIVLVYQGFPIQMLRELNNTISHIDNLYFVKEGDRIDLELIRENKLSILNLLSHLQACKYHFLIYEEFLLIPSSYIEGFSVKFKIIKNNFFDYYPNQAVQEFPDIEESLNNDREIINNDLFNLFYSDCKNISVYNCIKFLDYEANLKSLGVEESIFFNLEETTIPEYCTENPPIENLCQFQSADNSYNILKINLFKGITPETQNLLVDENIKHLQNDIDELKVLYLVLSSSDCKVKFYKKDKQDNIEIREELSDLLKKH